MIELVPASRAHIGTIANRLRIEDRIECKAMGRDPKSALRSGLQISTIALTAKLDGRAEAMMGLIPLSLIDGEGIAWMLSTEAVYRNGRALMGMGPCILGSFLDSSRRISNVVSQGNHRAIRLLRAWGFTVEDEIKMIGGVPFLDFWMERG